MTNSSLAFEVKENKVDGACSVHQSIIYAYTIWVWKHEVKIFLGRRALKRGLNKYDVTLWSGVIWLRISSTCEIL
jgi:hypothetical protein